MSEPRRFEYDRRAPDADRRLPSYDRRPPHLDDKRPPGYVDRRPLDDRRFPLDHDRRPLPEESRFPSQDMPSQEPRITNGNGNNGIERRPSVPRAMKAGGPASSSVTPISAAGTTGAPTHAMTPVPGEPVAARDVASYRRPISPVPMSVDGKRNSNECYVNERSSNQVASSQDRVSGTQPS